MVTWASWMGACAGGAWANVGASLATLGRSGEGRVQDAGCRRAGLLKSMQITHTCKAYGRIYGVYVCAYGLIPTHLVFTAVEEHAVAGANSGRLGGAVAAHDAGSLQPTLRDGNDVVGFLCGGSGEG